MSRFDVHYLGECIRTCVHVLCSRIGGVHIPQSGNASHSLSIEFGLFVSLRWFITTRVEVFHQDLAINCINAASF